tara:strand:- start:14316 stop:15668 length:1353 start_codon:yes stop_codon:yes gene_type:complete
MKLTTVLFLVACLAIAIPASAETYYLKDHPGWHASGDTEGKLTFTRDDRSITKLLITTYPAQSNKVASEEEVTRGIEQIVAEIVSRRPSQCAGLTGMTPKPNGMGFEVKNDPKRPTCLLFVSINPDKKLFANLWLENGSLPRDGLAYQNAARLWLRLAFNRLQGLPVVPTSGAPANLTSIAEQAASNHSPSQMLLTRKSDKYFPEYRALPIFEGQPITNCVDWDPNFYTPKELVAEAPGQGPILPPCSIFAWKDDMATGQPEAYIEGDWQPLSVLGQKEPLIFYDVTGINIEPFEPGEKLNFLGGNKSRLFEYVRTDGNARDLSAQDVWFTPHGRYTSGGFGLANTPRTLPNGSDGRYALHGHIAVFERDDGPILIALAGKIMKDGKINRIFIGDQSYGAAEDYEEPRNIVQKAQPGGAPDQPSESSAGPAAPEKPARIPLVIPPRKTPR